MGARRDGKLAQSLRTDWLVKQSRQYETAAVARRLAWPDGFDNPGLPRRPQAAGLLAMTGVSFWILD